MRINSWNRSTPCGDQERFASTTKSPCVVSNFTRNTSGTTTLGASLWHAVSNRVSATTARIQFPRVTKLLPSRDREGADSLQHFFIRLRELASELLPQFQLRRPIHASRGGLGHHRLDPDFAQGRRGFLHFARPPLPVR